jgi:hypothetical protein
MTDAPRKPIFGEAGRREITERWLPGASYAVHGSNTGISARCWRMRDRCRILRRQSWVDSPPIETAFILRVSESFDRREHRE